MFMAATPGGVNLPALALPQHRLYLFPEPQGQGALRAMGADSTVAGGVKYFELFWVSSCLDSLSWGNF